MLQIGQIITIFHNFNKDYNSFKNLNKSTNLNVETWWNDIYNDDNCVVEEIKRKP